jgi:hypothetical protein
MRSRFCRGLSLAGRRHVPLLRFEHGQLAQDPLYLEVLEQGMPETVLGEGRNDFRGFPISLSKWFTAMWMLTNCKSGVSSYEIHRALNVTQKTAWFTLHRIRAAIKAKSFDKCAEARAEETRKGIITFAPTSIKRDVSKHEPVKRAHQRLPTTK